MRAYVATTGVLFALLTLAHVWRVAVEPQLIRDPWFLLFTGIAAAFCFWAWRVLGSSKRA
jgi:hypothetical protein